MKISLTTSSICLFVALLLMSCSRSNNLLLGRVEAIVGGHTIAVTDCYRTNVPAPQEVEDPVNGAPTYRFTPCRDADIVIRADELTVNGKSYGHVNPKDAITIDHGKVLINEREAQAVAAK